MRFQSKLFYSYLFLLAVYAGFVLLPDPSPASLAQYRVSTWGMRFIELTIILILAAIWYAGFYGYTKLQAYTKLIRSSKDGKRMTKLTQGVFLVVLWLPISSAVSAILNYAAIKRPGLLSAVMIINIYVNLFIPLAGFFIISKGARGLSELVKKRPSFRVSHTLTILVIYLGLIYYRLVITTENRDAIYHMPVWLILTTIVAPYIYMWSIGLTAAYEIYLYSQKVAGIVYRKSLSLLSFGLCWLIVVSIGFQYLTTLSARLSHLSIYWILVIVYSLLLVLSVGFVLIALGARKLQKIEEI